MKGTYFGKNLTQTFSGGSNLDDVGVADILPIHCSAVEAIFASMLCAEHVHSGLLGDHRACCSADVEEHGASRYHMQLLRE
jgi:hypothetical protein